MTALWCVALLLAQDTSTPLSKSKLLALLKEPGRAAELAQTVASAGVDFELTPEIRQELAAAAPGEWSVIEPAVAANWVVDLALTEVKKTSSRDQATRETALARLGKLVRERGVEVPFETRFQKAVQAAGAIEQAWTLIWPPEPPEKPRLNYQLWRIPRIGVPAAPVTYDADAVWGQADLSLRVDGRVLVVLKHQSLFYNVACSADLEVASAKFTGPLPRLPADQWEYWVEAVGKQRGAIFACPADKRCEPLDKKRSKHDKDCVWHDISNEIDERGYSPARFVVDDPQKGRDAYSLVFRWALLPYTYESLKRDMPRFTPTRMVEKVYLRGAGFALTPDQEAELEGLGATKRLIGEIRGNKRATNRTAVTQQKK